MNTDNEFSTALYHESKTTEEWENTKVEADMEVYIWNNNKSKQTSSDIINWKLTDKTKAEPSAEYVNSVEQLIIKETFSLVSKREDSVCNFLEFPGNFLIDNAPDSKLIYRHYATLFFCFCVDSSESELGILDLIQVFVETLDKCFENVCELDLIFHADAVHHILSELVMGMLLN